MGLRNRHRRRSGIQGVGGARHHDGCGTGDGRRDGRIADTLAGSPARLAACAPALACRTRPPILKPDGTPYTGADLESEALILEALAARLTGIPVVAEESVRDQAVGDLFFLVDPLDGTRDFLAGNAGLHGEHRPRGRRPTRGRGAGGAGARPGVVFSTGRLRGADHRSRPGTAHPVRTRRCRRRASSPSEAAATATRKPPPASRPCGAGGPHRRFRLKFGLIASGEADIYVRCGPTMEWDTAAGDAIVTAAGAAWWCRGADRSATAAAPRTTATVPSPPWPIRRWRPDIVLTPRSGCSLPFTRLTPERPGGRGAVGPVPRGLTGFWGAGTTPNSPGSSRSVRRPGQIASAEGPGPARRRNATGVRRSGTVETLPDDGEDRRVGLHEAPVEDAGGIEPAEARGVDLGVRRNTARLASLAKRQMRPPHGTSNWAEPGRGPSGRK